MTKMRHWTQYNTLQEPEGHIFNYLAKPSSDIQNKVSLMRIPIFNRLLCAVLEYQEDFRSFPPR